MKIQDFSIKKKNNEKITIATCYDYAFACILDQTNIDCVMVGDSVATVLHGHPTTVPATLDMMVFHTQAVARGIQNKFIIGDLPFLTYRQSLDTSMHAVMQIMQAGAHAVKLEGAKGNLNLIKHIVESGVPVMGHLGLTPQSFYQLGGHKVQGREDDDARRLVENARLLEEQGCFSIVLECVPNHVAQLVTKAVSIPTIGIGAGPHTSGQVLVLHDLLGLNKNFAPKFLKKYLNGFALVTDAVNQYAKEVQAEVYPDVVEHSF